MSSRLLASRSTARQRAGLASTIRAMTLTVRRGTVGVPDVFTREMPDLPAPSLGNGGSGIGVPKDYDGDRGGRGDGDDRAFERIVAVAALAAASLIMTSALIIQARSTRRT